MIGLGTLIKALRKEKDLSVAELCRDICSERFLYMIENNDRTPSTDIISKLSERLRLDILSYMDYAGFSKPMAAKAFIDRSRELRQLRDYKVIEALTLQVLGSPDADKAPLVYEINSNLVLIELFYTHNLERANELIQASLSRLSGQTPLSAMESQYKMKRYYEFAFFNYYFIYARLAEEDQLARRIQTALVHDIRYYKDEAAFRDLYLSITINDLHDQIFIYGNRGKLRDLEEMVAYQFRYNHLNRIYFSYYLLAGHYYFSGDTENARKYYGKFIAAGNGIGEAGQFQELLKNVPERMHSHLCPEGYVKFETYLSEGAEH